MNIILKTVRDALLSVTNDVYHYKAHKKTDQYIVWAEDGENDADYGNDRKSQQTIQGTIDYFTKKEFDPNIEKIQEALNNREIPFYLNSVQYEEETGYIHYEWVWEYG